MKNNITELVFILDRSGSMAGLVTDTVGGFNSMIEKQKKEEGKCLVSTVLFNGKSKVLHDRVGLAEVAPMTEEEYVPCGSTALVDAIGDAITHIGNIHKYAREEDVPEHTVFVIMTDGQENSSHRHTSDNVKKMIEKRKESDGWEFLFIGANIDAVETASHYGIAPDRAANYNADGIGTHIVYDAVAKAVSDVRVGSRLTEEWSMEIDEDFKLRSERVKKDNKGGCS